MLKGAAKTTGKVILGAVTIVTGVFFCGLISGLGARSDEKKAEEDTNERDKASSEEAETTDAEKAQEAETTDAENETEDSGSVNNEDF